jgi:hypothetical protein
VTRSTMKKVITEVTNEDEGKMVSYPLAYGRG